MRLVHAERYSKQAPGRHIQMGVKCLTFIGAGGEKIGRLQYTATGDATRVGALRVCDRHTQAGGQDCVDHTTERLPPRIKEIGADSARGRS